MMSASTMTSNYVEAAGHHAAAPVSCKRSRDVEDLVWTPAVAKKARTEPYACSDDQKEFLEQTSILFSDLFREMNSKLAEMRKRNEEERLESLRIAQAHPLSFDMENTTTPQLNPSSPDSRPDALPCTRRKNLGVTPCLSPIKVEGSSKATMFKSLNFAQEGPRKDAELPPIMNLSRPAIFS